MKKISRRKFIGQASCAAVGSTAMLSSLLNLRLTSSLAAQSLPEPNNYKALVCLFLAGGNDSFNMVVPYDDALYAEYQLVRADLALPKDQLIGLNGTDALGRQHALHPGLSHLQELHAEGHLAFLHNVGTLVEPTDLSGLISGQAKIPLGLYSHADQIAHWQTAMPDQRTAVGWVGRMADMMQDLNSQQSVSMNISLSGNNLLQTGDSVISFSISPNADDRPGIDGYGDTDDYFNNLKTEVIDQLMDMHYAHLLEQSFAGAVKDSIEASERVASALDQAPTLNTQFSPNEISQSFRTIATLISVRHLLGMSRQTFFVQFGGWDHHDEVLNSQSAMFPVMDRAIREFDAALREIGVHEQVTTFSASDFGRTLTSNGRGSDHAWGGNQFVIGGAVRGGLSYGNFPALFEGNALDTGRGRLIPTTSVDEYFAELALWFGVDHSRLPEIFPNLSRFYVPVSGSQPLGFMTVS